MQREAPEAFDVGREPTKVRALYGVGDPVTDLFGRQCLLARRLVERGVRFGQVYADGEWDAHSDLARNQSGHCAATDMPTISLRLGRRSRSSLPKLGRSSVYAVIAAMRTRTMASR